MSTQFSGRQEFYPARTYAPAIGDFRKAATAVVFQGLIAGVLNTIAVQGDDGTVIANQAAALNADEVIINAMVAYLNGLGGGSGFIDRSLYTLAANVAPLANVYLYGAGRATILTIPAATDDCVEVNGVADWKLGFMTLRTTGAGANDVILLVDADDGEIFGVVIDDSGQDGLVIDGDSVGNDIHNIKVSTCARYGFNLAGDDNRFVDNRIDGTGNDGIWVQATAINNIVALNRISNWVGEAIDVDNVNNEVVHNVEV